MKLNNGILGEIAEKAIKETQVNIEKINKIMELWIDNTTVEHFIFPYEIMSAVAEVFVNDRIHEDKDFASISAQIQKLIFGSKEFQDIIHGDHTLADYGLALISAGATLMDLDFYADDVIREKLDNNTLTRENVADLAEANIQSLSIDNLLRMRAQFASECDHDCANCEHCPDKEEVKGKLQDVQKAALYSLINDGQIGADTIHNIIVSGSVTINELKANIKPEIFDTLIKDVHKQVVEKMDVAGHLVVVTKDRTIFNGVVTYPKN